jgi:hypothetical protein
VNPDLPLPEMTKTKFIITGFVMLAVAVDLRGADTNLPVIAIYTSDWGLGSTNSGPRVIAALWTDGRVVWSSASPIEGGLSYKQGRVSREKLGTLLDDLEHKGVFTNKTLAQAHFGPDSRFTTIAISDGRRRLKMQSWHELYEQNTNVVASAHGLESLGGRNRERVLESQPAEYRRFRNTWSEIRQAVTALIPKTGEPFVGKLQISSK